MDLVNHLRLSSKAKCSCIQLCLQTGLYLPEREEASPWGTVCCNTRVFCHVVPYSHPVQNWAALVTVLLGDHEEMVTACAEKVNHFSSMLEIISKYLR